MVNFGLNSASILGIFLAVAGASLYFMRTVRPELSKDHDIFFAAVGLLCGFILLFQGWRLDPILQFGQFLLTGSTIFFAIEAIRLRGIATEQARRNTPIVDKERPVSRAWTYQEAELDRLEPYEEAEADYDNPKLRGYEEPRPRRPMGQREDLRSSRSTSRSERYTRERPVRRPRPSTPPPVGDRYDNWEETPTSREESTYRPRSSRPESSTDYRPPSKRRPSLSDLGREYSEDESETITTDYTDYVDYQPLDHSDSDLNESDSEPRRPQRNPNREPKRDNPINFDY